MTRVRQAWFNIRYRKLLREHGLVAVPVDEWNQLCVDAAALLVSEVEAELIRVSRSTS